MGSPGVPINIGSYCSDFLIQDPASIDNVDGYYYRRFDLATNRCFYLTLGSTPGTFQEVESPIEIQEGGSTSWTWQHFRLRLHWDKTIRPVVETNSVIMPTNRLRYVSSKNRTDPDPSTIVQFDDGVITLRTTSLSSVIGPKSIVPFSTTSGSPTLLSYAADINPPQTVVRSNFVYLVNDDDDNKSVVTATTQKRYLIIVPPYPLTIGELDLFKPGVTEAMIKQTAYRINRKTSLQPDEYAVSNSLDVFRESVTRNTPTTGSTLTYRDIDDRDSRFSITINGNLSNSFKDTVITYNSVRYIVTPEVMDKTISDLYGEMSLGLFTLWNSVRNEETNPKLYLGYECATAGSTSCATKQLVVREYFNYMKPSASCQFRMYDLGNNEYMMLVTDPFSNPPTRYVMRPDSNGNIQYSATSTITKEERGWHLEPVSSSQSTHLVKLRWNYPSSPLPGAAANASVGVYISVNTTNTVSTSLNNSASTFVCIRCSRIDEETGTCASANPMYVDDDMNYMTSPVLVTPTLLDQARLAPIAEADSNWKISRNSDSKTIKVTDDGDVTFVNDGTESTFMTTRTGILTYGEKRAPSYTVFIARQTPAASGEYLYARYVPGGSPPNLKFVAATNPNVADGFGWKVDGNTISAVIPGSPSPSLIVPSGFSGITILRDFKVSFPPENYNGQTDEWTAVFETVKAGDTFKNGSFTGPGMYPVEYDGNGTIIRAVVRATQPRSPVTSPPTQPTQTREIIVVVKIGEIDKQLKIQVPEGLKPVITQTPSIDSALTTSSSITLRNLQISNMDPAATVTARLQALGSPGSASASPISPSGGSTTYGDFSNPAGFVISGLASNTRYSAPSLTIVNSLNKNPISFTMSGNFTTLTPPAAGGGGGGAAAGQSSAPPPPAAGGGVTINAAYMNGGAGNREFYLRVGSNYVKLNVNAGNVDDGTNRFWQTTDKNQASRFIVDTTKTYSGDSTYKGIKLASYYTGSTMTNYTGSAGYLRHNGGWIYKNVYGPNTSVDFHWKFEDVSGGMKIRNPFLSSSTGLQFVIDSGVMKLKNDTFSSSDTFTIEFSDGTSTVVSAGGAGGGVLSPTVLITSFSTTDITYTTSNSPTSITGSFGTSSTGPWTQITSSSTPIRLTSGSSFPTASSTVGITVTQTGSAQTFYFKLDATNSAGTNSATSSALSVPASTATGGGTVSGFIKEGTGLPSGATGLQYIIITSKDATQNYVVFSTSSTDTNNGPNRLNPTGLSIGKWFKYNNSIIARVNNVFGPSANYLEVTFYNTTTRQIEKQPNGNPSVTNSQLEYGTFTP